MLSKEEIEGAKSHIEYLINFGVAVSEDEPYFKIILKYIDQLETEKQKLIEKLEEDNKDDREWVKRYEAKRRNTEDGFYKKSYQTTIHQLNAKREIRGEILSILKGEDNGENSTYIRTRKC